MNPMRSTWMSSCAVLLALLYCSVAQAAPAGQAPDSRYDPQVDDPAYLPGEGLVIRLDTLHDNSHIIGEDVAGDRGTYWGFKLLLEADNNDVWDLDLAQGYVTGCIDDIDNCAYYQALAGIDVLVIVAPTEPIGAEEAALIAGWVSGELDGCLNCSRSLFLIADHPPYSAVDELSDALGLVWRHEHSPEDLLFVREPDPATQGELDTSHVVTEGRDATEVVTRVKTFKGSYFKEASEPLTGGVPILRGLSLPEPDGTEYYHGMLFRHGGGSVYASAEAAMFTAQLKGGGPGNPPSPFGMQTTTKCATGSKKIKAAQEYCNEQYLLNIVRWFGGKLDTDGDGFVDEEDSCLAVANADQRDPNLDGYGALCDGDYDDDGDVDQVDYDAIYAAFGTVVEDPGYDPNIDHDGDGVIGGPDLEIFMQQQEQGFPGPSGLTCAGTIPCGDSCDNDGVCEAGEYCTTCPNDCISGGGTASCGNGVCEPFAGEDCVTCAHDCNGKTNGPASRQFCCGDLSGSGTVDCSDSRCSESGYSCSDTPVAPYCCGNAVCEEDENSYECAIDCWPTAGDCDSDGVCEPGEDCETCPSDCEGVTGGKPQNRFCCGNEIPESPEGDGSRCDGNY
jgi:hypothetical protein